MINSIVLTNNGFNYQVGQYTVKNGNADGTNYTAALQQALGILTASTDPTKFLVFASDGLSNQGGGGFAAAVAAIAGDGSDRQLDRDRRKRRLRPDSTDGDARGRSR